MTNTKLLLTGATGYIGGSVLNQFLISSNSKIQKLSISVLVRKPEHAEYYSSQGINPIMFESLEQVDLLRDAARRHDIVVNTASAFQHRAAEAMIQGLAERKKETSKPVFYIHTSGTSSIANRPVTKLYLDADEPREFSDKEDVIGYELEREKVEEYGQRTTDLAVVAAGETAGVPTYILMSPTIYGKGTGAFNKQSIQIPFLMKLAMKKGFAEYIGEGAGVWDHAHIDDTAALYDVILGKLLDGQSLPSGRRGLYFASCGRSSWKQVSEHVAKAGFQLGVLKEDVPRSGDLEEMTQYNPSKSVQYVELGTASRSVTNAELSREIGWSPKKTEADWEAHFLETFRALVQTSES